jgi:16S rRNA (guanine966-N2)-methyltransferase
MRIIAGEFRSRILLAPPTEATRPITDRAKQSLFDILSERLEGASVLDAFAGTGSMGLECLSRGARRVVFVERGPACDRLRRNIQALGVETRSVVLPVDAYRVVGHPAVVSAEVDRFDIAFIDPPYAHTEAGPHRDRLGKLLRELGASALAPEGVIVLRHPTQVNVASLVPDDVVMGRELTFGTMRITLLLAAHDRPMTRVDNEEPV